MTTRRFRNVEHGLEKRGKPILLPLFALLLAVVVRVNDPAAGGSSLSTEASLRSTGEASGGHSVAAPISGCRSLTSLYNVEPAVEWVCVRTVYRW